MFPRESKQNKKSIKSIKKNLILKPEDVKTRVSKRRKDAISTKPELIKKNTSKMMKKVPPDKIMKLNENTYSAIPAEKAVQYNNYLSLSSRSKKNSSSGSDFVIRKSSNINKKNRDTNHSERTNNDLGFVDKQQNPEGLYQTFRSNNLDISDRVYLKKND